MNKLTKKITAMAMAVIMSLGMAVTANAEPTLDYYEEPILSQDYSSGILSFTLNGSYVYYYLEYTSRYDTNDVYAKAATYTTNGLFTLKTNLYADYYGATQPYDDYDTGYYNVTKTTPSSITGDWIFISSGHRADYNGSYNSAGLNWNNCY